MADDRVAEGAFTYDAVRRDQHRRFVALPTWEKLRVIDDLNATVRMIQGHEEPPSDDPPPPLAAIRKACGLSQREVARRLGITPAAVSQLERQDNPRWRSVQRYLAACEADWEFRATTAEGRDFSLRSGTSSSS